MSYHYRRRDEALHLMDGDRLVDVIPADGHFAILYDADGRHETSMPTILRHGEAEQVLSYYRKTWTTMQRAQPTKEGLQIAAIVRTMLGPIRDPRSSKDVLREMADDLTLVTLTVAEMTEAIIEEVNACLVCSNRIGRFEERLADLRDAAAGPADMDLQPGF